MVVVAAHGIDVSVDVIYCALQRSKPISYLKLLVIVTKLEKVIGGLKCLVMSIRHVGAEEGRVSDNCAAASSALTAVPPKLPSSQPPACSPGLLAVSLAVSLCVGLRLQHLSLANADSMSNLRALTGPVSSTCLRPTRMTVISPHGQVGHLLTSSSFHFFLRHFRQICSVSS